MSLVKTISFNLSAIVLLTIGGHSLRGQNSTGTDSLPAVEILPDDPVLMAMDQLLTDTRTEWLNFTADSNCLNVYRFEADHIPTYPDSVFEARMQALDALTPLELEYNEHVRAFIALYAERKREVTSRVLGLAALYYPLFEEKLDHFDMPLELKHLAVVESALNPSARSWVGATGLWQFMYNTGKIYGLEVTSYIDERSDPYQSTVAACRYMKFLYGMYGDWNLVLAAYNSGPGNVNKAIRRSGGKRDFWAIRPYLPRETRSYVPAFIAVNYVMAHAAEHNIYPLKPRITYAAVDTLRITRETSFQQIATFTGTTVEELAQLNPALRHGIIPANPAGTALYLPTHVVGDYLANEERLLAYSPPAPVQPVVDVQVQYYTVRRGDVLGVIADRHNVGLSELRAWNQLRSNRIYPGQKLRIERTVVVQPAASSTSTAAAGSTASEAEQSPQKSTDLKYHIVQSGDTLWDIANMYPGISVHDLKAVNSHLNYNRLKPGQKIKIPPAS